MQMYLFEPITLAPGFILPFASVNGSTTPTDRDHEYTHGLSNRLITDAQGLRALHRHPVRRDGRGLERLVRASISSLAGPSSPIPVPGDVKEGEYVDNGTEPDPERADGLSAGHGELPRRARASRRPVRVATRTKGF